MATAALNAQINTHAERGMRARVQQSRILADTEEQKVRTLEWKHTAEKHRTTAAMWGAHTEQVRSQRAHVGYKTEQVGLATDQVKLNTARVGLGKEQDKLAYEQADRYLTQLGYRESLTLKAIDVSKLREDVRHRQVLDGGPVPYFVPKVEGGAYGLPPVAGLGQVPLQRRIA
jgi:hypothetical protein